MKILVTGSSGFIGFHLVKKLISLGHKVIGVDNHSNYYNTKLKDERLKLLSSKKFKFYSQDINQLNIPETNIEVAINLAAQAGVRVSEDKQYLYESTNVIGFKKFCNFCEEKGIHKIIYASSSSVYSDLVQSKFNEISSELKPKSLYGESKLSNEVYAARFAKKTKKRLIGLRFFSVYGPFGRPDMAYYLFTDALKKNKKITLNNQGNMARDMTYIDDIVTGMMSSIRYLNNRNTNSVCHEIFNLGNDNPVKAIDLLKILEKKLNRKTIIKNYQTQNESAFTHADISKAKKILGYNPQTNIEKGIDEFLKWHKNYEHL